MDDQIEALANALDPAQQGITVLDGLVLVVEPLGGVIPAIEKP